MAGFYLSNFNYYLSIYRANILLSRMNAVVVQKKRLAIKYENFKIKEQLLSLLWSFEIRKMRNSVIQNGGANTDTAEFTSI